MRFSGFDLIRCVAIVLVLVAHIAQTISSPIGAFFGFPDFYYVCLGGIAVTLFLILSGAVLEIQYGNRKIKYSQFIARRILRIYPIYYLSLISGIIIYFIRFYHGTGTFMAGYSNLRFIDIILSITGGHAFIGEWGGPFVSTSWFIPLIMTMYIIFPFLSYQIKKHPIISIILLFIISFLSRLIIGKYDLFTNRPLDWFPLCRIFEFSLGIYLAVILPKSAFHVSLPKRLQIVISFMSKLSFPLFLVHFPLLFTINYLIEHGISQLVAICFFLFVSTILSLIIHSIDNKLPRAFVLGKI